mmetsp:Transcript_7300/g.17798  ORF Transcript_7300/g.17798 Transcript_7300/m.17798 type:complete len:622 (+) Transcript_7300:41-1906(+)
MRKMNYRNFPFAFVLMITTFSHDTSILVHATSSITDFSTEYSPPITSVEKCEDCISRARDLYSKTVSDPEQFCIENNQCVKNISTADRNNENFKLMPSNMPTTISTPTVLPNDGPTEIQNATGSRADTNTLSRVQNEQPSSTSVSATNSIQSHSPTMLPTQNESTQNQSKPIKRPFISSEGNYVNQTTDIEKGNPQSSISETLPANMTTLDSAVTKNDTQHTTVSSIFLKDLTSRMEPNIATLFSITALDFLREYSVPLALVEEIDFILVKVVGQGRELGNSTEVEVHVDGMHVFFETITSVNNNIQIDVPQEIEKIFKTNKNEFFSRLMKANDFFLPIGGKNRSRTSTKFLLNRWVLSSLFLVVCSGVLTAILLKRTVWRRRPREYVKDDSSKQDIHPLNSIEQTCSDNSTETHVMRFNDWKVRNARKRCDRNDAVPILMNSDSDSLTGLKLLNSDDNNSLAPSSRDMGCYRNQAYDFQNLKIETKIDAAQMNGGVRQLGQNARMRKRQIEEEVKKRKSEELTSIGSVLFRTSSINYNEEVESGIEVAIGHCESLSPNIAQKASIFDQISSIFRTENKNKQIHRQEPVRMIKGDDSDLSLLCTPQAQGPSKKLNFSSQAV